MKNLALILTKRGLGEREETPKSERKRRDRNDWQSLSEQKRFRKKDKKMRWKDGDQ